MTAPESRSVESAAKFRRTDFPPTKGWDRRVALANRLPSSAYKPTKKEINLAEVVEIFKAYDACVAYLALFAKPKGGA